MKKSEKKSGGAGVKEGLSEKTHFKSGPEQVSGQSGKNQVPKINKEKAGRFTFC